MKVGNWERVFTLLTTAREDESGWFPRPPGELERRQPGGTNGRVPPETDPGGHRNNGGKIGKDCTTGGANLGDEVVHAEESNHRREDAKV